MVLRGGSLLRFVESELPPAPPAPNLCICVTSRSARQAPSMGRLSSLSSARKGPHTLNGLRRFESKFRPWATQPPQSGSEGNVVVAVRRVAVWGTVERSCGLCNSKVLSHRISWEGGRRRCPRSPLAPAGPNYHACPVEYLFEPSVSSPPPTRNICRLMRPKFK